MADKPINKLTKALPDTKKFNDFVSEWLANGGNGVQAALKVYDTTDYSTAGVIATENIKKLRNAGSIYLESKGIGYGKMIDLAVTNMNRYSSKTPDWWDRVMKLAGWEVKDQPNNDGVKRRIVAEEYFND